MQKTAVHAFAPSGQAKAADAQKREAGLRKSKTMLYLVGASLVIGGGVAWYVLSRPALPAGFAAGNGRLEANQIYVASKYPGRVKDVLFNEGDTVETGQVVARSLRCLPH